MTKKILFIFLTLFCFIKQNVNAQKPKAISENAVWIVCYGETVDGGSQVYTLYRTSRDTLIHGLNYVKLLSEPLSFQGAYIGQGQFYTPLGPLKYSYAFRNDTNNRAYIIPAHDSVEHLWYDFNLAVGDTIHPRNPNWYSLPDFMNSGDTIIVKSIDSTFACNKYYKRYTFRHTQSPNNQFPALVQGIGFGGDYYDNSGQGDLINQNYIYFESFSNLKLFCCDTSDYKCNLFITGVATNTNSETNILIYPNPTSSAVTIDLSGQDFGLTTILIRDITGKLLRTIENVTNEKTISLHLKLPSGMYLLELQGTKKSFQRLISIVN